MVSKHDAQVLDQFSLQAEAYGRLTGALKSDRAVAFRTLVAVSPGDVLLDVCCGTGSLTLDLAPFVDRAVGLDLTPAMLEQARTAQAQTGVVNVQWIEGDANRLPFEAECFSLVVCSSAFHHLERPRHALREMARVCRGGGRIAVRDVTPLPEKVRAYDAMEKMRDPSHCHALTADELLGLGMGLNLEVPQVCGSVAADLSLDAILATSFPESCSIEEIRAMFEADAISGENALGFDARMINGKVHVSYPMSTVMWRRV